MTIKSQMFAMILALTSLVAGGAFSSTARAEGLDGGCCEPGHCEPGHCGDGHCGGGHCPGH